MRFPQTHCRCPGPRSLGRRETARNIVQFEGSANAAGYLVSILANEEICLGPLSRPSNGKLHERALTGSEIKLVELSLMELKAFVKPAGFVAASQASRGNGLTSRHPASSSQRRKWTFTRPSSKQAASLSVERVDCTLPKRGLSEARRRCVIKPNDFRCRNHHAKGSRPAPQPSGEFGGHLARRHRKGSFVWEWHWRWPSARPMSPIGTMMYRCIVDGGKHRDSLLPAAAAARPKRLGCTVADQH